MLILNMLLEFLIKWKAGRNFRLRPLLERVGVKMAYLLSLESNTIVQETELVVLFVYICLCVCRMSSCIFVVCIICVLQSFCNLKINSNIVFRFYISFFYQIQFKIWIFYRFIWIILSKIKIIYIYSLIKKKIFKS